MINLIRLPGGGFDVALADQADAAAAVATVVYAALYTDAQAPSAVEADAFDARGWWADPAAGTGLWYLRRTALDDQARADAVRMVEQALARSPALTSVVVDVLTDRGDGVAGNVSQVSLSISGQHNGISFLVSIPL
ncbi:phage GP46 family protein [Rhodoferax sp. BLA1]|uniref:phage GP46 family protein n=1 Tax=Rhodoferax sp. BLA1 TaxID=2576062 RepID=UPI0015D36AD2|nr:phage GP46 family protein [Rhodoferax sp. BLA1]